MKKLIAIIIVFVLILVGAKVALDSNKTKPETDLSTKQEVVEATTKQELENKIYAPEIEVYDIDGNKKTLADFSDKPILMNFFSSYCTPCKKEMPGFQKAYDEFKDDYHFVIISAIGALGETEKSAKKYISKNDFTFPVYFDTDLTSQYNYGVYQIPTTFIIDNEGVIRRGQAGIVSEESLMIALADVLAEISE